MTVLDNILNVLTYDAEQPMIFSSGTFLWLFLGFTFIYMCLQKKMTARLVFVTLFSYFFYYKSSGVYFFLLAVVTVSDWLIGGQIGKILDRNPENKGRARWLIALSVIIDLSLLAYFKYTNFFLGSISEIIGNNFQPLDIFLPVGISFFTFQSLSYTIYTIDIYRREIRPLPSLLDYAFFVSFFPQLVAGPIVKARDFVPQIRKPLQITRRMFGMGVYLIIIGLFKKAVISDYISINFVERVFDQPDMFSGLEVLLGIYGYVQCTLQVCVGDRFLAPLAHLALHMAATVSLYLARRQPQGKTEDVPQPLHDNAFGRSVARCFVELHPLGSTTWCGTRLS